MVHLTNGDTDFFDIIAGVFQGDTFTPFVFIICQNYAQLTSIGLMKENSFSLKKERKRRYTAESITDVDCTDNQALLANTPAQAESVLHNLQQVIRGISL